MIELPSRVRKIALLGGAACTMFGGLVLWKEAIGGQKLEFVKTKKEIKEEIENKVFIVTGANSGIGREVVHELARKKGKVYMACRDMKKCEEERKNIVLDTKNKYVYCRKCDLENMESIREFVNQFKASEKKCDVLVNNAGVMKCRKMFTKDGIEAQLGVNHFGPFLLTNLLKPQLEASGTGRVVYLMNLDYRKGKINFSDLNSSANYDPTTAFNQSQLANMLTVQEMAKEWKNDMITVNAVYPGVCSTNIKRHMGVDKSISGNIVASPILWLLTRSPERGAQTVLWAAMAQEAGASTGKLFSNMKETDIELPDEEDMDIVRRKMTAVSKYWTGLQEKEQLK